MQTEQEIFWAGKFGDEYYKRNNLSEKELSISLRSWSVITRWMEHKPLSILEIGCNIGINLMGLSYLFPDAKLDGIEINREAAAIAQNNIGKRGVIFNDSILAFIPPNKYDLVFTRGVLIHINPEHLTEVYKKMNDLSNQYIVMVEYYNPVPVEVNYRGHSNRLFKRDFAGEMLDLYPSLALQNYGFFYYRDEVMPLDDVNWFLLRKDDK